MESWCHPELASGHSGRVGVKCKNISLDWLMSHRIPGCGWTVEANRWSQQWKHPKLLNHDLGPYWHGARMQWMVCDDIEFVPGLTPDLGKKSISIIHTSHTRSVRLAWQIWWPLSGVLKAMSVDCGLRVRAWLLGGSVFLMFSFTYFINLSIPVLPCSVGIDRWMCVCVSRFPPMCRFVCVRSRVDLTCIQMCDTALGMDLCAAPTVDICGISSAAMLGRGCTLCRLGWVQCCEPFSFTRKIPIAGYTPAGKFVCKHR